MRRQYAPRIDKACKASDNLSVPDAHCPISIILSCFGASRWFPHLRSHILSLLFPALLFLTVLIILTPFRQKTFPAFRRRCLANGPPQGDDLNIVQNPMILRQYLHQLIFHFFRVILFCQPQLFGNPLYMGIHTTLGSWKILPRITFAVLRPTPAAPSAPPARRGPRRHASAISL